MRHNPETDIMGQLMELSRIVGFGGSASRGIAKPFPLRHMNHIIYRRVIGFIAAMPDFGERIGDEPAYFIDYFGGVFRWWGSRFHPTILLIGVENRPRLGDGKHFHLRFPGDLILQGFLDLLPKDDRGGLLSPPYLASHFLPLVIAAPPAGLIFLAAGRRPQDGDVDPVVGGTAFNIPGPGDVGGTAVPGHSPCTGALLHRRYDLIGDRLVDVSTGCRSIGGAASSQEWGQELLRAYSISKTTSNKK